MYKKIIAGIMSMCMLCSISVVNAEENNIIYGDANCDGVVNVCDVAAVKKHIVKLNELSGQGFINADIGGNGDVGVDDLGSIIKYIIKVIDSFEEEPTSIVTTVPEETTSYEYTTTTMPSLSDYVPMESIKMSISNGETTVYPEKMMVHATVFDSGGFANADGYPAFYENYVDYLENPPVIKFSTELEIDTNADTVQESMKIFKYGDKCEYITRINSLEEMLDFESGQYLIQFTADKNGEPIPALNYKSEEEFSYFFIVVDLEK